MNDRETVERLVNEAVAAGVHKRAAKHHKMSALGLSEGRESLESAALLGVWSAAKEWGPGKGPWLAWARGAAKKGIADANKSHKRAGKVGKKWLVSLDEMHTDDDTGEVSGPEGTVKEFEPDGTEFYSEEEAFDLRVGLALDGLGRDTRKGRVFDLLTQEWRPADIARELGLSIQNVMDYVRKLRPLVAEVFRS